MDKTLRFRTLLLYAELVETSLRLKIEYLKKLKLRYCVENFLPQRLP